MFVDNTNFCYSNKDIKYLFNAMNNELSRMETWLNANKLSLNTKKTKYCLFRAQQSTMNVFLYVFQY